VNSSKLFLIYPFHFNTSLEEIEIKNKSIDGNLFLKKKKKKKKFFFIPFFKKERLFFFFEKERKNIFKKKNLFLKL